VRNAMIAVSVMLAIFLGWPLVFGDRGPPALDASPAQAHAVSTVDRARMVPAVLQSAPRAESCYKRFHREVQLCSEPGSAACRLKVADNWDLCEATGFWPR